MSNPYQSPETANTAHLQRTGWRRVKVILKLRQLRSINFSKAKVIDLKMALHLTATTASATM
jgi:hypothetical protein